jgi:hypothetical protein
MTNSTHRLGFPRYLAVGLVVIYLAVGLFAAACPADAVPAAQGHGHHHGGAAHGTVAHSLLCAWSCQVSPLLDLTPATPLPEPLLLIVGILITTCLFVLSSSHGLMRARAPPLLFSPVF